LHKLQRASAIAAHLDARGPLRLRLKIQLLHAYRLLGRDKEAVAAARLSLDETRELDFIRTVSAAAYLLEDACWTLRQHGDRRLLADLDRMLASDANPRPVLVERARLHAALGDLAAAEKDLDLSLLLPVVPAQADYTFRASACLMKG